MISDAIIVDIDGTIARHPQRGHHEYSKVFTDEPIYPILRLVEILDVYADVILFVSGRPDSCREDTVAWIEKYLPHIKIDDVNARLLMRKAGDFRKDDVVKEEILDNEIISKYRILYILDDRNRVVAMWRRRGYTVLQVADGDF